MCGLHDMCGLRLSPPGGSLLKSIFDLIAGYPHQPFFQHLCAYHIYPLLPCISKHETCKCLNFAADITGNCPFFSETFENNDKWDWHGAF